MLGLAFAILNVLDLVYSSSSGFDKYTSLGRHWQQVFLSLYPVGAQFRSYGVCHTENTLDRKYNIPNHSLQA